MLRNLLLIALFSISAGVIAPGRADASCGDWLAHPSQTSATERPATDAGPAPAPSKCDGPLCGQSPGRPLPMPSPPPTERHHHEAACLSGAQSAPLLTPGQFYPALALDLPSGFRLGVDRPPRS